MKQAINQESSCPLHVTQPAQILIAMKAKGTLPLVVESILLDGDSQVSFGMAFADAPKGAKLYSYGPISVALTMRTAVYLTGSTLYVKEEALVFKHLEEYGVAGSA